jgi:hypothetical protein
MSAREVRRQRGSDSGGAVGTAVGTWRAVPTAHLRRASGAGAWQPRGGSALTGGPGAAGGG